MLYLVIKTVRKCWSPFFAEHFPNDGPDPFFGYTKEDIGIEQQLDEIVRGKNFSLNCLSWKLTEMIMITNEVIPENLVVVRQLWEILPYKPTIE